MINKNRDFLYNEKNYATKYQGSDDVLVFDANTAIVAANFLEDRDFDNIKNFKKLIIKDGFIGTICRRADEDNDRTTLESEDYKYKDEVLSLDDFATIYKSVNFTKEDEISSYLREHQLTISYKVELCNEDREYTLKFFNPYFNYCNIFNLSYVGKINEYEVIDNKFYTAHEGSLYSKNKTILISYKQNNEECIKLPEETLYIADCAFFETKNIKEIYAPSLKLLDTKILYEASSSHVKFFALNCEKVEDISYDNELASVATHYVFIMPKVNPKDTERLYNNPKYFITHRLVLGFILYKEYYDEKSTKIYESYIEKNIAELRNFAFEIQSKELLDYLRDNYLKAKDDKQIAKLSKMEASSYLEERILLGSDSEINNILSKVKEFAFMPKALSYACLYSSLDVVKSIINNKDKFASYAYLSLSQEEFKALSSKTRNYFKIKEDALYALALVASSHDVYSYSLSFGEYVDSRVDLRRDGKLSLSIPKKIQDEKTRLSTLKYLIKLKIFNKEELQELLLVAMAHKQELIFNFLLDAIDVFDDSSLLNIFSYKNKAFKFYFNDLISNKAINLLLKFLDKYNIDFAISTSKCSAFNVCTSDDLEFIKVFIESFELRKAIKVSFVTYAIETERLDLLTLLLDSFYKDVKKDLDKSLDSITNTEIKALILNYAKVTSKKDKLKL